MTSHTGRILVVDDETLNRTLLSVNLTEAGYVVATAEDGQQALAMLRASSFDLVLLDLIMPVMSGFDALETIKADAALHDIPVIVVSAESDMTSLLQCLENGAADFLPKPFDPVMLRAKVDLAIRARPGRRA